MERFVEPLTDRHDVDRFESGRPVLDQFLKQQALFNQSNGFSRTHVIVQDDRRVVGYFSLCAGMINRKEAPRQVGGHGAPGEIPVALLARLAVDRQFHRQGIGRDLLRSALLLTVAASESVAFRAVMVHPLDDEARLFYRHFGFRAAKGLEQSMLLPMQDILAAIGR
ncbi:GNAT family N-acetyltransferase [Rhizobium sp. CECT 9324]|jgi:GNAT superfamily N-acetyltransferase|uniref:GNAT family N-acetyltransferase n=1 Tax=Rhizobium sp. CECT 9324 TaxID=2845820 RepID=UPI001E471778|nr:GNAT family N-acetyltransferase [Rhizobium sp. CECT 9324]CAH0340052.1 hypothetical protein RHI9324_01708 [Rhizobium sp. CECT 9324]